MNKSKISIGSALLFVLSSLLLSGCPKQQPQYYTLEDLRSGLKEQSFWFENINKRSSAKVELGYQLVYPASMNKRRAIAGTVAFNPSKYRIKKFKAYTGNRGWNDNKTVVFDWNEFSRLGGSRGDLVFLRGNGKYPDFVKIFSNWTHVAMVDNVYDKKVFESMPKGDNNPDGVNINYAPTSWSNISYFLCSKIGTLNYTQIGQAIDWGENKYRGLPYFPKVETSTDRLTFVLRWSDKDNVESMYCSKLVYNTFKNNPYARIDFDSNNTAVFTDRLWDNTFGGSIFAWIGVSPDDVYYSENLWFDFYPSSNLISDGLHKAGIN